ncbi:hypothetical protein F6X40_36300 [Paraburkholderia sp. UCT31]|uniref:hypothetical protein n=1 Tax=Paraburkholderia sp. UCT31 TaxID=2615209 RepID=UPI0016564419|nr:hypothetical protein [Paraburkholderia sp. UCT31]MBC8742003.1 hypothetical protein [Paraburkholderia sp. UCT31]
MSDTEQTKNQTLFKGADFEIRRQEGQLIALHKGAEYGSLADSYLVAALLERIAELETTNDRLTNQVGYLKQDNAQAWQRHSMANSISSDTSKMLMDAKDEIRRLSALTVVSAAPKA